jgi:anthranilate phosphoribosyltransferase
MLGWEPVNHQVWNFLVCFEVSKVAWKVNHHGMSSKGRASGVRRVLAAFDVTMDEPAKIAKARDQKDIISPHFDPGGFCKVSF